MITCAKLDDPAPLIAYLRRDVLANDDLILALERNMPPVPRTVWSAAEDDGTVVGILMLQDFTAAPDGELCASLRLTSLEALPGLLQCLAPTCAYRFIAAVSLRGDGSRRARRSHVILRACGALP